MVTAEDFMAALEKDPEYQARIAAQDAATAAGVAVLRRAEQPIVQDLKAVGVDVSSVWDLVNTSVPYPDALPVLKRLLVRGGYPDRVMESLGRALTVGPARPMWDELAEMYQRPRGSGEEVGLAVMLSGTGTEAELDRMMAFVQDETLSPDSRLLFLDTIHRVGGERGRLFLGGLLSDAYFWRTARSLLRTKKRRR